MARKKEDVGKAEFFLVRHGRTSLNKSEKFRGWSDDDSAALDKKGLRQAKVAGRFLSRLPLKFGLIVSSDLDRALHTAAIVATFLGINDIHKDARLRPINVGDYTGESKEGTDIDFYLNNPSEKFPDGESIDDFRARQKSFQADFSKWIASHPNEKAVEVAHLSNVIYWEDMEKTIRGYLKDYATDKEDLVRPGGVIAIMPDDEVVPLLGENKKFNPSDKGDE